ncbi:Predicted mechanosensitive ion channel [Phaffia rhodozyma]|uniref:Mechanosensitive ion channel protein n=1 Tax=Phaffia rhodozyma TaxID=264483 RepID=A0A0F7ST59_PHARH|nr:Predicted mechanosensitive ion channel [Phaffia rhodozyma]
MSTHRTNNSIDTTAPYGSSNNNLHEEAYGGYDMQQMAEKNASRTRLTTAEETGAPVARHFQPSSIDDSRSSTPIGADSTGKSSGRAKFGSIPNWDVFMNNPEFNEFDVRNGGVKNLEFAEGDVGSNKFTKFYYYVITKSIFFRWATYIIPVLILLWIPGIIWLTAPTGSSLENSAYVWGVNLLWWSIWLTVVWVGWWAVSACFMILPRILRVTVAAIVGGDKSWVEMVRAVRRPLSTVFWTLLLWITFQPLISTRQKDGTSSSSASALTLISKILFGMFLCTCVLAGEKVIVQFIAYTFHQQTYKDRTDHQDFQIKALTILYKNSSDMGRSDTLKNYAPSTKSNPVLAPQIAVRKALKGLRNAAATTTNALGNVATEMVGSSVLQPNSPQAMVTASLGSANKTRALARRIYYSFRMGKTEVTLADIARHFPDLDTATRAFEILDADLNGGASRDEIEMSLGEIHRERLSLASSMRDVDGAVRRLDTILVSIVFLICVLILTATITTALTSLVTSAGTFLLGLSWLIGATAQEVLSSCIFLFIKHPFDVGDRVDIDSISYVVSEMNLLSTTFQRVDGKCVFLPNNVLNQKLIENVRRSGPTSETFAFDVAFNTSFEHIQALREKMLKFLKGEKRDFIPSFDVTIVDFPDQAKLQLKANICYKSNWQQGLLKVQRHNKWVCALKEALKELKIYGSAGDPTPDPVVPIEYTLVPYEPKPTTSASTSDTASTVPHSAQSDRTAVSPSSNLPHGQLYDPGYTIEPISQRSGSSAPTYSFVDQRNVIADPESDVFGEETANGAGPETEPPTRVNTPAGIRPVRRRTGDVEGQIQDEVIEMNQNPNKAPRL